MADDSKRICMFMCDRDSGDSDYDPLGDILVETLIKPALNRFPNLKSEFIGHEHEPGSISGRPIEELEWADLLIADLSQLSASGYFELGRRYTLGLPVVLIAELDYVVPVDADDFLLVRYSMSTDGADTEEPDALARAIEEALKRTRGADDFAPPRQSTRLRHLELAQRIDETAEAIQLLRVNSASEAVETLRAIAEEVRQTAGEQSALQNDRLEGTPSTPFDSRPAQRRSQVAAY